MRCAECDVEIDDRLAVCPLCSAQLRAARGDVGAQSVGRTRRATPEEANLAVNVLRADSVLALTGSLPDDLSTLEAEIARMIDGFRPVARIRKKIGTSSAELRQALKALHERGVVRLVGIVEEAGVTARGERPEEDATRRIADAEMMYSAKAMAEVSSMLEEEKELSFDDETEPSIEQGASRRPRS